MGWAPLQLGTSSDLARDQMIASVEHTNCFAEQLSGEAKHRNPIFGHAGFEQWGVTSLTVGDGYTGDCRGLFGINSTSDTFVLGVFGIQIHTFTTAGVAYGSVNSIGASVEQVTFAYNRNDPIDGYLVGDTGGGTLTSTTHIRLLSGDSVSVPTFDAAVESGLINSVCHMDGYFIFTKSNGEFVISEIDGPSVDPLDFATCQNSADGLLRGLRRGDDLCLFGPQSVEFWDNTGNADFPFERRIAKNYGIFKPASAVNVLTQIGGNVVETVVFTASGPDGAYKGVCLLNGYEAVKISTWQVDADILADPNPENIRGFTYTHQGVTWYVITGRTFTWQCNLSRGTWSRRKSNGLDRWKIHEAITFNGETLLGRYVRNADLKGVIYRLSDDVTPAAASELSLRHSKDNGTTWSTARTKAIGDSGERDQRLIYQRLGQARGNGHLVEMTITNAIAEGEDDAGIVVQAPIVHAYPARGTINALAVDVVSGTSETSSIKGIAGAAVDFTQGSP